MFRTYFDDISYKFPSDGCVSKLWHRIAASWVWTRQHVDRSQAEDSTGARTVVSVLEIRLSFLKHLQDTPPLGKKKKKETKKETLDFKLQSLNVHYLELHFKRIYD